MADSKMGIIQWYSPDPRAIIPLSDIKVPRSLKQILKKNIFQFTINADFRSVIINCSHREDTWISEEIIDTYCQLNECGFAHSVETWQDGVLSGGLYGVVIGGAFFGESMFSLVSNASKAAFYVLTDILIRKNFILLDSQFLNPFTESLGAIEIPKQSYLQILRNAINLNVRF